MKIDVDRAARIPMYLQIADQLRQQILAGELPGGQRLPAERKLAERLGVNRTTVLNAYEALKAEGLLEAAVGSGTMVRRPSGEAGGDGSAPAAGSGPAAGSYPVEPVWNQLFSRYAGRFESGLVRELWGSPAAPTSSPSPRESLRRTADQRRYSRASARSFWKRKMCGGCCIRRRRVSCRCERPCAV